MAVHIEYAVCRRVVHGFFRPGIQGQGEQGTGVRLKMGQIIQIRKSVRTGRIAPVFVVEKLCGVAWKLSLTFCVNIQYNIFSLWFSIIWQSFFCTYNMREAIGEGVLKYSNN